MPCKGVRFNQDLWNCFAHIRKWLKMLWKFMETIQTFPKMLWTFSDVSPRMSFAKHKLTFSFENWRIFHKRTVIYVHFLIHYNFKYKWHVYILHIFQMFVRYGCRNSRHIIYMGSKLIEEPALLVFRNNWFSSICFEIYNSRQSSLTFLSMIKLLHLLKLHWRYEEHSWRWLNWLSEHQLSANKR